MDGFAGDTVIKAIHPALDFGGNGIEQALVVGHESHGPNSAGQILTWALPILTPIDCWKPEETLMTLSLLTGREDSSSYTGTKIHAAGGLARVCT